MVSKDMFRFIHIPKTAGTAVLHWLRQYFPDVLYGKTGLNKPNHMHRSAAEWRVIDDDQVIYFTVVRHPYTRLISYYNYIWQGQKPLSFRQFLETQPRTEGKKWLNGMKVPCPWIPQTAYVYDKSTSLVGKVFRQEHLELELQSYFRCNYKLPKVNVATQDDYQSYVEPDLMDLCYRLFREDFVNFDYRPWTITIPEPDIPPLDRMAPWFEIPQAGTDSNKCDPTSPIDQEIAD
jgi:hypothetical protein